MVVGEIPEAVDLLIVGGGPGGYVAARRAAALGREVVLVDQGGREGGLGGSCLHVGCIPSKALIELGDARQRISNFPMVGLAPEAKGPDMEAFQVWKGEIVDGLATGVAGLMSGAGVTVLQGRANYVGRNRAAVELTEGGMYYAEFQDTIVACGSTPVPLPTLPFDGRRVISSTDLLALDVLPGTLAVVGGGAIGLELGSALAKLGVKVTIVEALDRLLAGVDRPIVRPLERSLKDLGIEVLLGATASGLDETNLIVEVDGSSRPIPADQVLVAIGRRPATDEIGLEKLDVATDQGGFIEVDEQRLARPHVAAIGDVTPGPALAHKAGAEAVVAAEALCGLPSAFDPATIPVIVFTDPEIAIAGLNGEEARANDWDVAIGTASFAANGRAATLGTSTGLTQVVVDKSTDRVVGVQIVGPHASELITTGVLAIEMLAAPDDVLGSIFPHPTLSETLQAAVEAAVTS